MELEDAIALVTDSVRPINDVVYLPLKEALGKVLAEDLFAPFDFPPFDRSAMDGFAVQSTDCANASAGAPIRLKVSGIIPAGEVFRPIAGGETVKIMTGAAFPQGSDCCIPKEKVAEKDGFIEITSPPKAFDNYIFRGEDFKSGSLLIKKGTRLDCCYLTLAAETGKAVLPVLRPPKIAIVNTGTELCPPGGELSAGKIYNSNGTLFASRLAELGFDAEVLPTVRDEVDTAASLIGGASENFDVIISTGAVSVGDYDIMGEVFNKLGAKILFSRLALKPGPAVIFGIYENVHFQQKKVLLAALSGNPAGAMLVFDLVVRPALAVIASRPDIILRRGSALLATDFIKQSPSRRFIRAAMDDSKQRVSINQAPSSWRISSLIGSDALIDIPAGSPAIKSGAKVTVWRG